MQGRHATIIENIAAVGEVIELEEILENENGKQRAVSHTSICTIIIITIICCWVGELK